MDQMIGLPVVEGFVVVSYIVVKVPNSVAVSILSSLVESNSFSIEITTGFKQSVGFQNKVLVFILVIESFILKLNELYLIRNNWFLLEFFTSLHAISSSFFSGSSHNSPPNCGVGLSQNLTRFTFPEKSFSWQWSALTIFQSLHIPLTKS